MRRDHDGIIAPLGGNFLTRANARLPRTLR